MALFFTWEQGDRKLTPGVKGTFHKGFTVWESNALVLFLIPELFVRLSFDMKLELYLCICMFFNVFCNCGRFLHYINVEHSNWIETLFAATEQTAFECW